MHVNSFSPADSRKTIKALASQVQATIKSLRIDHRLLAVQPGHLQGTSSPVASSTLREISGSGTDRTHGLRPDSPVPPRACMGDPYGPPAHLGYLNQVWDSMEPALRARLGSISLHDAETSLALARATADVDGPGRSGLSRF